MQLRMEGGASTRACPNAVRGALVSSVLILTGAGTGLETQPAQAQSPNPDTQATDEYHVCKSVIDDEIARGKMTVEWEHMGIGLCAVTFYQCKVQVAGRMGDTTSPDVSARIHRCVMDRMNQADNYSGDNSSQGQSDNTQTEPSGCTAQYATNHPEIAIKRCTKVLSSARATDHEKAEAYSNRAIAEVFKSGLDPAGRAASDSNSALRLDPNVGAAHLARGLIYRSQRRHQEAISEFDAAIAENMETWLQAEAYYGRAIERMHLAVDNHDKSLVRLGMDDVGQAIELHPTSGFYNWRATMDDALGDKDAAQKDRDQANRLKEENQ